MPRKACSSNAGAPAPSGLSEDELAAYERLVFAYSKAMGLRPQTLYGNADSPVALAAYQLDQDARSYAHIAELFAGQPFGDITRDDILDNIPLTG